MILALAIVACFVAIFALAMAALLFAIWRLDHTGAQRRVIETARCKDGRRYFRFIYDRDRLYVVEIHAVGWDHEWHDAQTGKRLTKHAAWLRQHWAWAEERREQRIAEQQQSAGLAAQEAAE